MQARLAGTLALPIRAAACDGYVATLLFGDHGGPPSIVLLRGDDPEVAGYFCSDGDLFAGDFEVDEVVDLC